MGLMPPSGTRSSPQAFGPWAGPGALGRHQTHDSSGWGVIIYRCQAAACEYENILFFFPFGRLAAAKRPIQLAIGRFFSRQ